MNSRRLPNRWGIALAAVIMQICLGAVYGWSVFKIPLMPPNIWVEFTESSCWHGERQRFLPPS